MYSNDIIQRHCAVLNIISKLIPGYIFFFFIIMFFFVLHSHNYPTHLVINVDANACNSSFFLNIVYIKSLTREFDSLIILKDF